MYTYTYTCKQGFSFIAGAKVKIHCAKLDGRCLSIAVLLLLFMERVAGVCCCDP